MVSQENDMNGNHRTQQVYEKPCAVVLHEQICGNTGEAIPGVPQHKKFNPRFVGLIMAILLPGSAHVLSGHWKTGIAWYFSFFGVYALFIFILSLPTSPSFTTVIAIKFKLFFVIYLVSLFVSSYRPTRRFGCGGWILSLLFLMIINTTVTHLLMSQIRTYIGRVTYAIGPSMHPTIKTMPSHWMDITINVSAYRSSNLRRGDIVEINTTPNKLLWVKRVVGLPGETVDIAPPYVLINGKKLLDPPIFSKISSQKDGYSGYVDVRSMRRNGIALPITLGPDEYFLLGDNSPQSEDSRMRGPVPREKIVGKGYSDNFSPLADT
jgi:signal peptidase I